MDRNGRYFALDIAKYIVNYCNTQVASQDDSKGCSIRKEITHLRLQKTLYFAWIEYYKAKGRYLYADEIQAWNLGPVVPDVYYEYCMYGGAPIKKTYNSDIVDEEDKRILNRCIDKCNTKKVSELVHETHRVDRPWDIIYSSTDGRKVIPFDLIIEIECKGV